jgi:hypothetical protein
MTSTKIHCECCNKDYSKSYFKKHLLSKKHLKNQAATGIVQPIVVQPPQDVSNKKHCECCNKHYAKNYFKRHLKSKKHLKNQIKQEREQVVEENIEIPKDLMKIIVGYKEDLEKYADIDNFFDRVDNLKSRSGRFFIEYILKDKMKHSELLEMFIKEFGEDKTLITYGLTDQQMEEDDPEYHNEVGEIFFQYNKRAGGSMYYFSLE